MQQEVIQTLVDAGADINARNNDGETPLHNAATTNTPEVIQALLDTGADINARNNDGDTPLDLAIKKRQPACSPGTSGQRRQPVTGLAGQR